MATTKVKRCSRDRFFLVPTYDRTLAARRVRALRVGASARRGENGRRCINNFARSYLETVAYRGYA